MKVEKRGGTKMIRCLEVALYQTRESRERRRKAEEFSSQICTSSTVCVNTAIFFSLTLPIRTFRVIKWKENKQILFLYIGVVIFSCNATNAPHGRWQIVLRKSWTGTTQEFYKLHWTNPGSNTLRNNSFMATDLQSLKPSK